MFKVLEDSRPYSPCLHLLAGESTPTYRGQSICFCKWSSSISFTFFMVSTCFGIPFSVMTFCYYKILKTVQDSKKKTKGGHGPPNQPPPRRISSRWISPEFTRNRFRTANSRARIRMNPLTVPHLPALSFQKKLRLFRRRRHLQRR